eukprot:2164666-Rhodomonas_salina.2
MYLDIPGRVLWPVCRLGLQSTHCGNWAPSEIEFFAAGDETFETFETFTVKKVTDPFHNETFKTFRKRLLGAYARPSSIKVGRHTKAVAHELHCIPLYGAYNYNNIIGSHLITGGCKEHNKPQGTISLCLPAVPAFFRVPFLVPVLH